jgi:predicted adenylyl cyclase CyaB
MSSVVVSEPFPEVFSDEEASAILEAIKKKINIKFSKDEDVPKTILVDAFGTQNSGKTTITTKIEQVFRRHKFKAFCPPETAEIESVRNQLASDPMLSQAIHLNGVEEYLYNLAKHPRVHFAMISRGPIDMLYWYERDRRKGVYSDTYFQSIAGHIYEILKMDLVDAFLFFTCSVEAAMEREYLTALTQKRGSKMNEKDVAETLDIYKTVLDGVNKNVPGLPIFHINTSNLDVRAVGQEVLRFLLPTVCQRFSVPSSSFMPNSPTLMRKQARLSGVIERQLKLKGHPSKPIRGRSEGVLNQEDVYLNFSPGTGDTNYEFDEILRIRKDDLGLRFMYKGQARDSMLSHRHPLTYHINSEEAERISKLYPVILTINKVRECYELDRNSVDVTGPMLTLHVDTIEGLGIFTEIRARGASDMDYTEELLTIATELGFKLSDVVRGSYLSLALKNKS